MIGARGVSCAPSERADGWRAGTFGASVLNDRNADYSGTP
jgi:hypothetical protein